MSNGDPIVRRTENLAWEVRSTVLELEEGLAAVVSGVAVDARRIYLTHYLVNPSQPLTGIRPKLVMLDADTLTTLKTTSTGGLPRSLALSSRGNQIMIAGTGPSNSSVSLFQAANLSPMGRVDLTGEPVRVASGGRGRAYVTSASKGLLHVLEEGTGAALSAVNVGVGALGVAVDEGRIFVTLSNASPVQGRNGLVVVDAASNAIVRTVAIQPAQSVPQDVAVLSEVKRIFVAHLGLDGDAASPRVTVLNSDDFTVVGQIPLPASATHLAADQTRNCVYAATAAGLVIVDGRLNRVKALVPLGHPSLGVAVNSRTGQVVTGDPAGGILSAAAPPGTSPFDLTVLRPDDLLHLECEFHNLTLVTTGGTPRLVRRTPGQPAFLVVHLAAQSVAEQANASTASISAPLPAVLSGPSRLAFRLPDGMNEVPYTLEALLAWSGLEPSLSPAALAPGTPVPDPAPALTEPLPTHTAIELPYRLLLSPDRTAAWEHAPRPVVHGDRAELWHTRLRRRDGTASHPLVRAVWTPDLRGGAPAHAEPLALEPKRRTEIVRLSSDWTLTKGPSPYTPEPADVDEMMLSALGGFLRLRAAWNGPPGLDLALWQQVTTLGRDHKVMAVTRGRLLPWGHRAAKVVLTEREVTSSSAGPVAALRKRTLSWSPSWRRATWASPTRTADERCRLLPACGC